MIATAATANPILYAPLREVRYRCEKSVKSTEGFPVIFVAIVLNLANASALKLEGLLIKLCASFGIFAS